MLFEAPGCLALWVSYYTHMLACLLAALGSSSKPHVYSGVVLPRHIHEGAKTPIRPFCLCSLVAARQNPCLNTVCTAADEALQAQLRNSFQQLPPEAAPLASLALMHQLQVVEAPSAVQLCFTLLQLSLGLLPTAAPPSKSGVTKKERQTAQALVRSVDESSLRQLLQQPWVMSHWLTGHPLGQDVAVAWSVGLSELLHSVLALSHRAESAAGSALRDACQPYIMRYDSHADRSCVMCVPEAF